MLVMICGLPGTGKTTLAKAVAERINAVHISSDTVRMKMLEERTYSAEEKEKIYDTILEEAEKQLKEGKNVILDATFYKKALREKVRVIAADFFIVECTTHENLIKERIFARKKEETESEADYKVYKKVKTEFEPIAERHFAVDTSLPLEKQVELVMKYIEG